MKKMSKLSLATLATISALSSSVPAAALVTTFATYIPANQSVFNMRYEQTATASGNLYTIAAPNANVPGATETRFSFVNSALASLGVLDANLTLFASVVDNPALSVGGFLVQNIDRGSFSFTYSGLVPLVVGSSIYTTGANLLSGFFTNANGFGTVAGSSGSVFGSTPEGSITYTSDFLTFGATSNKDFSLALTSITPVLSRLNANSSIASFRASSSGLFSTEAAVVPEPEAWAMLVVGFGFIGLNLRSRSRNGRVSA